MRDPILVTGPARSGTSMVAGILARCGAFTGPTVPANPENPRGFYEHTEIRERVLKRILKEASADPLGVKSFPPPEFRPSFDLRTAVRSRVSVPEDRRWLYKGAKVCLTWRAWAEAFPDAVWILCQRPRDEVVNSCRRSELMGQHSQSVAFWQRWYDHHQARLDEIRAEVDTAFTVRTDEVAEGDFGTIQTAVAAIDGLSWDAEAVRAFVEPGLFGGIGA